MSKSRFEWGVWLDFVSSNFCVPRIVFKPGPVQNSGSGFWPGHRGQPLF
jgi:hypothetical protein